ncbi:hypothetical protein CFC21_085871 [Triticum aestivum]|uniref:Tyrosinase copper-binding domain-containing protein n=2 Tax=Triticum aestivum TaxID=4565 RepID=A0A3B6PD51_WHEAT|nr:hypothetical protein CFC21_085871 [Triticum aestivum]
MREPDDDPRSFSQQWHVHCAYCEGAYEQIGYPKLKIDIHRSWLFFPWHRLYLYFYERILGNLIDDDTFALPFWNWDAPHGMTLPVMYTSESSPLYDSKRNPVHLPPAIVNLDYNHKDYHSGTDHKITTEDPINLNLKLMYRQMIAGAKKTELFLGTSYRAGEEPRGPGTIECEPHNTVHDWTGESKEPSEDMGNLYSAARDPVFFAHHGNVDRMWNVWRCLGHTDFTDTDWLDSNFLFYDEEARLVRVHVRDCLDTLALRYTYQDVPLPWLTAKPTEAGDTNTPVTPTTGVLPAVLDGIVRVDVPRTKVSRSRFQKDEEEEVLIVEGIEIADSSKYVKFDVHVNAPQHEQLNAAHAQFAGSVVLLPHMSGQHEGKTKMSARFGISDLLDSIRADGDKKIIVSLVPRSAGEVVTVGAVRIGYIK